MNPHRRLLVPLTTLLIAALACSLPSLPGAPGSTSGESVATTAAPAASPTPLPPLPPSIIETEPAPGEALDPTGSISLYFDQTMDAATVEAAFSIEPSVEGELSWPDGRTLRFQPSEPLARAQFFQIEIGSQARSAQGVSSENPLLASFETAGYFQVSQVQPAPASADISATADIRIAFNQPVVSLEVDAEEPHPLRFDPPVNGQGEWVGTSLYVFHPEPALPAGQRITATVDPGLVSPTGALLAGSYSWAFTTGQPQLISASPTDETTNFALDSDLKFTFNQPISQASFEGSFALEGADAEPVPGNYEWSEGGDEVLFDPEGFLAYNDTYTASFAGATGPSGVPLVGTTSLQFSTVPEPAVVGSSPTAGGTKPVFGSVQIFFAGPMDEASLVENLSVSPAIENLSGYWSAGDRAFNVNGRFEAGRSYTLTIGAEARDAYGSQLGRAYSLQFRIGDYAPDVRFPLYSSVLSYTSEAGTEMELQAVNVNQVDLELYRLTLDQFLTIESNSYPVLYGGESVGELIRSWTVDGPSQRNVRQTLSIPLAEEGSLPTGLYLVQMDAPADDNEPQGRLILVRGSELVLKAAADDVLVWATDLRTGESLDSFAVRLVHESTKQIGGTVQGRAGIAHLDPPGFEDPYQGVYAIVGEPGDELFGVTGWLWSGGLHPYQFGIPGRPRPPESKTYLYTDRPLYRPGQTVHFRGALREQTSEGYQLPDEYTVEISLVDSNGETVETQELSLSTFGTVNGSFQLGEEAPLGLYRLETETYSLYFDVAAYRKPEFAVQVTPSHEDRIIGEPLTATIQADYYFGAPVGGEEVQWHAYASSFWPPDLPAGGGFERVDYLGPGFVGGITLAQGQGVTGPDGKLQIEIPTDLEKPRPLQVTIEATLSEDGDLPVSGRTQVRLHPASVYLSLVPIQYSLRGGEQALVRLRAADVEGNPLGEQSAAIRVYRVTWEQIVTDTGRVEWQSTETLVNRDSVETEPDGSVLVSFVPPRAATFKIEATSADPEGRPASAEARVWVVGQAGAVWRQPTTGQIELVPDRESYAPGEEAQVLIPSPFDTAVAALVTVERESVLSREIIELPASGTMYALPLEGQHAPNVFLSVVLLRPVVGEKAPALAAGLLQLEVSAAAHKLDVDLSPQGAEAGPGESVSYQLQARLASGEPAQAEFSLSLVDEALLALTEPNSELPFEALYSLRPLSVRTAASLTRSGEVETVEEALGRGGGGGADAESNTIRSQFEDTAYWNPTVVTDEEGRAEVSLRLPDNLTTWRVEARGITARTEAGSASEQLTVSKPLLIRPVTPRFFTAGDNAAVAAEVHNNTGTAIGAEVRLQATGAAVGEAASTSVSVPAGGSRRISWTLKVGEVESVGLTFSVEGGGYRDASTPTIGTARDGGIPVHRYRAAATAATSGSLAEPSMRTESISLPPRYDPQAGALDLTLEPSLGSVIQRGLEAYEGNQYESTEYLASRLAVNAASLRVLLASEGSNESLQASLEAAARDAIDKLEGRQDDSGGWGWWPSSSTNSYLTAYALHALLQAQGAGFQVDPATMTDGGLYLQATLVQPASLAAEDLTRQTFILTVLSELGQAAPATLSQMAAQRDRLPTTAKALLVASLAQRAPADVAIGALVSDLETEAILSATGTHWDREPIAGRTLRGSFSSTAHAVLALLAASPDSPSLQGAARWLVLNRTEEGDWGSTHETGWALQALLAWVESIGSWHADYPYSAALNGDRLAEGRFIEDGLSNPVRVSTPIEQLLSDEPNALTLQRGAGPGSLSYTAHLTVFRPAEDVPATQRGLAIERAYYLDDGSCDFEEDPCQRVDSAAAGDNLLVRLTVTVPHDSYYVAIEDRFPAGTEPIDPGLQTSSSRSAPVRPRFSYGWLGWRFNHIEIDDDRTALFADYLPAGAYTYVYRLHASFCGEYRVLPARAWLVYFPEVYGQSAGRLFAIEP